jgi:mandelamide amidase
MAPLAVAEDTHGSIRVPASMCGLAGLRPTYGRYPGEGTLPITQDKFDQPGPLARTVSDLALFDAVVTGDTRPITRVPLAGVRLGIAPAFFFQGMDADVERIVSAALEKLESAGAIIVKAELPESLAAVPALALAIGAYEFLASLSGFLSQQGAEVSCEQVLAQVGANTDLVLKSAVLPPNAVPADTYRNALRLREELKATILSYFRENNIDAIVFPPVLCPPPALGDNAEIEIRGRMVSIDTAIGRNTALGPFAGMPGLVLPAGMTTTGLPVGIEFEALPGRDRNLLALGLSVEGVLGRLSAPKV